MAAMFDALARASATGLADSIVQGTLIAAIAFMLVTAFRNRDARSRFSVLLGSMIAIALLPLLRVLRAGASSASQGSLFRVAESWVPWLAAVWAVCAAIGLLRVAIGLAKLMRIRRKCRVLDSPAINAEVAEVVAEQSSHRRVRLLVSDEIAVPSAVGFFRPAVLLPAWVVEELPAAELKHVVVHELSHLRRWDDWTNLIQKIVKALFFFHPAVWWMESRLSLEREIACDDAVLRTSNDRRGYAECLAHLAERSFLRRSLSMAQAAVSRVRETSRRVARILSGGSSAKPFGRYAATTVTVLAVGTVGALLHAPEVVSFGNRQPAVTTAQYVPHRAMRAAPKAINAAWHMKDASPKVEKVPAKAKARSMRPTMRTASVRTPAIRQAHAPRVIQASIVEQEIVSSSFVVVMQGEGQIAVWHITTWHYEPSRQVVTAQKTT